MSTDVDVGVLFRAHQREVFVFFLRSVGDSHVAEDLAQETFARAFQAAWRFRGESSLRTWLFGVARNVLHKHFNRMRSVALVEDIDTKHNPDPSMRHGIEEALACLSPADRETLVLCDVLEFTPSEAAAVLGVTPNVMRVRLHRARARFQEVYTDVG